MVMEGGGRGISRCRRTEASSKAKTILDVEESDQYKAIIESNKACVRAATCAGESHAAVWRMRDECGATNVARERRRIELCSFTEPDGVEVGVEFDVGQVRVAVARGVKVELEVGFVERRERLAQPAHDRELVRRAVEVDAVNVQVAHEPQDAFDPVVVPARREGGRDHRRVDLAVGQRLVPRRRVVVAQVLAQPHVALCAWRADEDLAAQRRQRPQLSRRARQLAHRVVELHLGAARVRLAHVGFERLKREERVVDVRLSLIHISEPTRRTPI
eukprot:4339156-Pleurochrysis_carterae.AAC.2